MHIGSLKALACIYSYPGHYVCEGLGATLIYLVIYVIIGFLELLKIIFLGRGKSP